MTCPIHYIGPFLTARCCLYTMDLSQITCPDHYIGDIRSILNTPHYPYTVGVSQTTHLIHCIENKHHFIFIIQTTYWIMFKHRSGLWVFCTCLVILDGDCSDGMSALEKSQTSQSSALCSEQGMILDLKCIWLWIRKRSAGLYEDTLDMIRDSKRLTVSCWKAGD